MLYAISGDMFQGSLIDSGFRGISTIEIVNVLRPDVASLGNHETDYGIANLLFLENVPAFQSSIPTCILKATIYASEVGKICDVYRTEDIDFTVLLTHIDIEEEKQQRDRQFYLAADTDHRRHLSAKFRFEKTHFPLQQYYR